MISLNISSGCVIIKVRGQETEAFMLGRNARPPTI